MVSRCVGLMVVLGALLLTKCALADTDSLLTCEFIAETTASDLSTVDCRAGLTNGTPHWLIVWAADPALPDSALPSFASAVEDSLMSYLKVMSKGGVQPILVRARRPGGASGYAFVADSAFATYKSTVTDQAGRVGQLNVKFLKKVVAAGVDISGVDDILFIYNSNPYRSGTLFGHACLIKPAEGTVDTSEVIGNGRTIGWFMETRGASFRYLWSRSDAQKAARFEMAHEIEHLYGHLHSPGSEPSSNQLACSSGRTYCYGRYSIMRATLPFDDANLSHSTGDFFPLALPDNVSHGDTIVNVAFDDAGQVIRNHRKSGYIYQTALDSLSDERLIFTHFANSGLDAVLNGAGLAVWRIYTRTGGFGTDFSCAIWDVESAVGRFTSGSPDPTSGTDSLDLWYKSGVSPDDKDYLGSGNDLFSGSSGRHEFHGDTNPSTKGYSGTLRSSARTRYTNVAVKNIVAMTDSASRADIFVGYDTLTVTSSIDSVQDAGATMSPNGEMVAWTRGIGSGKDIFVEGLEDHSDRHRMGFTNHADWDPSWDPFSGLVAFVSDSTGQAEVYTGQYNGLGVTKLTSSTYGAFGPAWSTKGDSIVYLDEDEYGQTRVMKISAFGGTPRPITQFADIDFGAVVQWGLSWSPDATKLSYLRNDSLFTMDAVGGNQTFLVTGTNLRGKTSWSPDGDWIVYEDANSQLRRVKISNTSDNTRWTVSGRGRFTEPSYQPWGTRVGVTHKGATIDDIWTYRFVENEAPVLDSVGTKTVAPGATLTINLSSSDPDGDSRTYDAFFLPSGASFSGNSFSWTPSGGQVGSYKVKFRVVDLVGVNHKDGADHEWVTINVTGGGGCPFVDTKSAEGWVVENSILGRSLENELADDLLQLKFDPQREQDTYSVRIRENENEQTTLDQASLIGVDHPADFRVFRRRGAYVLGHQVPPYRVTNAAGQDVTHLVDGSQSEPFVGEPGETLTVDLVAPALRHRVSLSGVGTRVQDGEEDPPVLNSGGKEIDPGELRRGLLSTQGIRPHDTVFLQDTGIIYQVPDVDRGWRNVERIYPRADYAESVPDSVSSSTFRLVFVGQHQIRFIGRLVRSDAEPSLVTADLSSAQHSRLGDVKDALTSVGSGSTSLAPGDTLNLSFTAAAPTGDNVRTWFLASHGVYTTLETQNAFGRGPGLAVVPIVYSLGSARPNPSAERVSMQYSLAKPGRTTLRVYSGSGRLVRTLVDSELPAGTYEAVWDGRNTAGAKLGSGVYFYRLSSGDWQAQNKVTLISQ